MVSSNWINAHFNKGSHYEREGKQQGIGQCLRESRSMECGGWGWGLHIPRPKGARGKHGAHPRQPTSLSFLPPSPAGASHWANPTRKQTQVGPSCNLLRSALQVSEKGEKEKMGSGGANRRHPTFIRICWLTEKPASDRGGN